MGSSGYKYIVSYISVNKYSGYKYILSYISVKTVVQWIQIYSQLYISHQSSTVGTNI